MSRLAAVANALYYPTPLELVEPLLKHIRFSGYDRFQGTLLDPTCGEGLFALALAAALIVSATRTWPLPLLLIAPGLLAWLGCVVVRSRLRTYGYFPDWTVF